MGHMKNLHIELMNESLCKQHQEYINQIHQSGLPLWMAEQYEASLLLEHQEIDNRELAEAANSYALFLSELTDDELETFYQAQEADLDYLCSLNGFEEDNPEA